MNNNFNNQMNNVQNQNINNNSNQNNITNTNVINNNQSVVKPKKKKIWKYWLLLLVPYAIFLLPTIIVIIFSLIFNVRLADNVVYSTFSSLMHLLAGLLLIPSIILPIVLTIKNSK